MYAKAISRPALPALLAVCVFLAAILTLYKPAAAVEPGATQCPPLLLEHWKHSTNDEKMSFLFGFATMLEMEKDWQHNNPLPIEKSLVGSWARGLDGVTFDQMRRTVDDYAVAHPDKADVTVLEVLGMEYVRPKLTQKERELASTRYREIRKGK